MIPLIIQGNPVAKVPARIFRQGGKSFHYDPKGKDKHRIINIIRSEVKKFSQFYDINKLDVFKLIFRFYMPIRKNKDNSKENFILWGLKYHNETPDSSNLVKFYEDCANNLLWHDDCMIVKHSLEKHYSTNPRVEIMITPLSQPYISEDEEKVLSLFSPSDIKDLIQEITKLSQLDIQVKQDMDVQYDDKQKSLHNEIASILLRLSQTHGSKFAKLQRSSKKKKA